MAYKPETVLSTPSRRQIYSTFNLCRGNDVCINSVNNQTRLMRTSEISSFEYIAATPRVRLGNSSFVTHDTLASKSKMSEGEKELYIKDFCITCDGVLNGFHILKLEIDRCCGKDFQNNGWDGDGSTI